MLTQWRPRMRVQHNAPLDNDPASRGIGAPLTSGDISHMVERTGVACRFNGAAVER